MTYLVIAVHLMSILKIFEKLIDKGVKLRPDKCKLFQKSVKYLGKIISSEGYKDDQATTEALDKIKKAPETVGELRKLLGFLEPKLEKSNAKNSSKKSAGQKPSKTKISWENKHQKIVDQILQYISPILAYPNFDEPFIVHCDASESGLGAVLYQNQDEKLRVIAYGSRTLSPAEKNYHLHSGKLEFLALKWAVCDKFREYLYYSKPFTVYPDNNPLSHVLSSAKINATGMRWVSALSQFQFVVKYRPGKISNDCDFLSRIEDFSKHEKEIDTKSALAILNSRGEELEDQPMFVNTLSLFNNHNGGVDVGKEKINSEKLSFEQKEDIIISPIYKAVAEGKKPAAVKLKHHSRKTKQLFRHFEDLKINHSNILVKKIQESTQIVLPNCFHHMVYVQLHEKMGHLGSEKLLDLAKKRFYWPGMSTDINTCVKKKCKCLKDKRPNLVQRAGLGSIESTIRFEIISIDYLHLDKCKGEYEYFLVVVDNFTRSAQAAADRIFNEFVLNFGFPMRIHHDRGVEFNNKLWNHLHKLTGVQKANTTPYHPMGNE